MATQSSVLAWEIPWTEELGVHGVAKESDTTEQLHFEEMGIEMSPGREAACRAVFGTWGFFPNDARKN